MLVVPELTPFGWGWRYQAGTPHPSQGPLVAMGSIAAPGPGDCCSAAPVAPAGPTSAAPTWEKRWIPGNAVTAAARALVRAAAGGRDTRSQEPCGHHGYLAHGDRLGAVIQGWREGAWHRLPVLIIPPPLAVPALQPGQALDLPAQGPSHSVPAPDTSPGDEEARIPAGHPDTNLPSQALP